MWERQEALKVARCGARASVAFAPCSATRRRRFASAKRLIHLRAARLDDRREAGLLGAAVGDGVGDALPERRRAVLEVGLLHVVAVERLLGERVELLDDRLRQAGR